jgi:hypothetical protein
MTSALSNKLAATATKKEPAFKRGNPSVVMALDILECTVTFHMPKTSRFEKLIAKILNLNSTEIVKIVLADIAVGITEGYTSKERICAGHIYNAI